MRILGIDPGSSVTGYGVVERRAGKLVHVIHGTVRPPAGAPLASRLDHLYRTVAEVIARQTPDCVAVEQVFVSISPRSALVLGQARGAILAAVAAGGLPVNEYTPARIKRSVTGNGRADKRQVKFMVKRLLNLERAPASDAADALAAAISHANCGRLESLGLERSSGRPRIAARDLVFDSRRRR
jgi:crossover junction endodeoxyribonuclease RuvC